MLEVEVRDHKTSKLLGWVREISLGGMSLVAKKDLQAFPSSRIKLCAIGTGITPISIPAIQVYHQAYGEEDFFFVGYKFTQRNREFHHELGNLISHLSIYGPELSA